MAVFNVGFKVINYAVFALAIFFVIFRFIKSDKLDTKKPVALSRKTLIKIMMIAFASRLVLLLLSWGVTHAFGLGRDILDTWKHWDANAYLHIANSGYFNDTEGWIRLVFYPLYPAVIWLCNFIFFDVRISGLLVSWLSFSGACVYLYKLILLDWDEKAAKRAVKYLIIFPITVFFGAPFTESLFLLLSFACLYYARLRKFSLSCMLGLLAALTRNVGVLLVIPIFIEMLFDHELIPKYIKIDTKNKLRQLWGDFKYLLIIPLGTVVYLLLNHFATGDAFYFLTAQQTHWSQSFGSYANTLHVSLSRALSLDDLLRNRLTLWWTQFAVLLIGGMTMPIICKKMRISYGAYTIAYLFIVFAPTWLLSGFRYYMGLAVLYPAIAMLTKHKWVDIVLTTLFAILVPLYTFCFSVQWQVI